MAIEEFLSLEEIDLARGDKLYPSEWGIQYYRNDRRRLVAGQEYEVYEARKGSQSVILKVDGSYWYYFPQAFLKPAENPW